MKVGRAAVISLLLLIIAVGAMNLAEASGNRLEGMVTDQNGVPIRGVKVNTWDGKTLRQAVSDREGKFYVSDIVPGTFFAVRLTRSKCETVRMGGLRFPDKEDLSLTAEFVQIHAGSDHIVKLPSNPSTGYSWTAIVNGRENILSLKEKIMEQQDDKSEAGGQMKGRPGNEIWKFNALTAGRSDLLLAYRRSWEGSVAPLRYHICSVTVR
ncbi:MAG: protease inhibitor I42 family protein [Synergistota bacterium]|nr:protease inhibitor I42 family protein [Synergistota bacterium]